jgi:hypothetical protein
MTHLKKAPHVTRIYVRPNEMHTCPECGEDHADLLFSPALQKRVCDECEAKVCAYCRDRIGTSFINFFWICLDCGAQL